MHFHWQNLNERRASAGGNIPTGLPRHGRAWLRGKRHEGHIEWALGGFRCGLALAAKDEGWLLTISVPLVSLWLGLNGPIAYRGYGEERELSWRIFDWAFWWNHWTPSMSWSSRTSRWRNGVFHFNDFLLGKTRHSTRPLAWRWVRIPMPERVYYGAACLEEASWGRARWFTKRVTRCEIKMLPGEQVPFPGKGENSWDCGEDATYGMTCPASSVDDAIGKLVASVLCSRTRNGGRDWMPKAA